MVWGAGIFKKSIFFCWELKQCVLITEKTKHDQNTSDPGVASLPGEPQVLACIHSGAAFSTWGQSWETGSSWWHTTKWQSLAEDVLRKWGKKGYLTVHMATLGSNLCKHLCSAKISSLKVSPLSPLLSLPFSLSFFPLETWMPPRFLERLTSGSQLAYPTQKDKKAQ